MTIDLDQRVNVVLVTIDCLRPDYLGCYNDVNEGVEPTIDELARTGYRFENAFATASQTPISFPGLATAEYPLSRGGPLKLSDDRTFVAEWFSEARYRTAGFSTNHWLSYMSNYPTGFDDYFEYYEFGEKVREHACYLVEKGYADGKCLTELETELRDALIEQYETAIDGCEKYLAETDWESGTVAATHKALRTELDLLQSDFEAFADQLDADLSQPGLFESARRSVVSSVKRRARDVGPVRAAYRRFQRSTYDEPPRQKPVADAERVTDEAIDYLGDVDEPCYLWIHYMDVHRPYLPGSADDWTNEFQTYVNAVDESVSFEAANEQWYEAYTALYKACIRYVDDHLARLHDSLASLDRETAVVLTADHGEEFREHGGTDHNAKLYDVLIHVPLIVSQTGDDGVKDPVTKLFSHVDLLPTVYSQVVHDTSVPDTIDGQDIYAEPRKAVIAETLRTASSPEHEDHVGRHLGTDYKRIAARSHGEKLIYYEDESAWQLYDLNADPVEQQNLIDQREPVQLRERVLNRERTIETQFEHSDRSRGNAEQPEIIRDRLDDLGYTV
ncbi:sulfatase-like hydrolase/transferase [Haloarcula sp. GH36]|uniref:sulfatase-like hydrolase/transferase n=1 Tax=Haloarcula montana TaxID=3111776 RepID=UPI002D770929|nr:sulfatase-like hydrolase/transferase [Haloarcula sp. GH36]